MIRKAAVGLRQDVGEVARPEARVDRHEHRADLLDGEGDEDPVVAVVQPQGDVLAVPDPGRDQAPRRLVDARRDLAEGIARGAEHQRLAVRQAGRDVVREIAEATLPICVMARIPRCSSRSMHRTQPRDGDTGKIPAPHAQQPARIVRAVRAEIRLQQREPPPGRAARGCRRCVRVRRRIGSSASIAAAKSPPFEGGEGVRPAGTKRPEG